MIPFTVHSAETAPAASRSQLEATRAGWGFIPTLHGTLAESPVTLEGYRRLFALVAQSSFSPAEQQVLYLAVSAFHRCTYCVAGHTYLARAAQLPELAIAALRQGTPIPDPRLEALRAFAEAVVRERGFAGDAAVDAFVSAGFTRAQVLEVVLVIATKTISNYVNHLTHTPPEAFMRDPALGWTPPTPARGAA
jgi:AhpD family alkylhydroperoxidase